MIDAHVHLRDWQDSDSETIKHGLEVAKMCGFTHVFDMPNTSPKPVTTREVLKQRLELADLSKVDGIEYHTYIGLTKDVVQVFKAVNLYNEFFPRVVGFKLYAGPTTGDMEVSEKEDLVNIFNMLNEKSYKGVVAAHCEKSEYFRTELYIPEDFSTHSLARPTGAEVQAISEVIDAAVSTGFGGTVHICHVTCKDAIEFIKSSRIKYPSLRITFGVTPHHALLTSDDAKDNSKFLKVNPPLRDEYDRQAVFDALMDGTADWIESDHAPHSIYKKTFLQASGVPGFAGYLHLIKKLREADISPARLDSLVAKRAGEVFGIEIKEEDLVIPRSHVSISRLAQKEYKHAPYDLGVGE